VKNIEGGIVLVSLFNDKAIVESKEIRDKRTKYNRG